MKPLHGARVDMFDNAPGLKVELHFPVAAESPEGERGVEVSSDSLAQ